jgi:hypothetical protein
MARVDNAGSIGSGRLAVVIWSSALSRLVQLSASEVIEETCVDGVWVRASGRIRDSYTRPTGLDVSGVVREPPRPPEGAEELGEWLRRRREARRVLEAFGVDLTWADATEQRWTDELTEHMAGVIARLERVGYARGVADTVAELTPWHSERHPAGVVQDGIGRPRG